MAIVKGSNSHGPDTQSKVRRVLVAILDYADGEVSDSRKSKPMVCRWADDGRLVVNDARVNTIWHRVNADKDLAEISEEDVKRSFGDLAALQILTDRRGNKTQGVSLWQFDLTFQRQERQAVLAEFDRLWREKWPPESKYKSAPAAQPKSGLKPGAPMPQLRLPENFVARPEALAAVKGRLLGESGQTLVVSAIAGLGGLGKSVLATALVLDAEVQARFEDGILWITLGQNPDLQNCLGDWIRALDKSRDSFSATTLESAKGYLHNLLAERRMLLVVDDVWNSDEAEWFRVGGAGCRVLVTTRKEEIEGADCYALDLMTEAEAIELVRRKLGKKWRSSDETAFLGFAKSLGYLPLALDLAANLVRDGVGWGELRAEFEAERREVALGLLDSTEEDWERFPEERRRKYSLQACFNLSLNRLSELQRSQFAWLGVLPEDVNLTAATGRVLWDLSMVQTKRVLKVLRSRSLLMDGPEMMDGERSYRVHDLIHDMAQGLIEKGEAGVENLVEAHRSFLGRYRGLCGDGQWWKPPYNQENPYEFLYFYRHLTWHLEQAGWADEVHDLMAASDELGRNAWFEACDQVGLPAVFVGDVARGWRLAEALYGRDNERSIVLQGRYSLVRGTLNSLMGKLSGNLLAALVKEYIWSVEKAWAYIEQIQEQDLVVELIISVMPYLSKALVLVAAKKARTIQDDCDRGHVFSALVKTDKTYYPEALESAALIEQKYCRAWVLASLAEANESCSFKAWETAISTPKSHPDESMEGYTVDCELMRVKTLINLAKIDPERFPEVLQIVRSISDEYNQSIALIELAKIGKILTSEALNAARSIWYDYDRALALSELATIQSIYLPEALDTVRLVQYEDFSAHLWTQLAQIDNSYLPEALSIVSSLDNDEVQIDCLIELSKIDIKFIFEASRKAKIIRDNSNYVEAMLEFANIEKGCFCNAIESAREIQNADDRAWAFVSLSQFNNTYLAEALEAGLSMKSLDNRARLFSLIANIDGKHLDEALKKIQSTEENRTPDCMFFPPILNGREWGLKNLINGGKFDYSKILDIARSILSKTKYTRIMVECAKNNSSYLSKALELTRSLPADEDQAWSFTELAKIDNLYTPEALESTRKISNNHYRTQILSEIAKIDNIYFDEALEAARLIENIKARTKALTNLLQIDPGCFAEVLETAKLVQEKSSYAKILSDLAKDSPESLLPSIYRAINEIPDSSDRAIAISSYIPRLPLATLSHADWQSHLHLLAHRKRGDLMEDLATLHPAIIHLGGQPAIRGIVDEMKRICQQWP